MSLENPSWDNRQDRELYEELFYRNNNENSLTEQEEKFCRIMYHYEEYASGLDGDRE